MTATTVTPTPFVPIQTRSERPASFDPEFFSKPTIREANWKLSDLARLAPLFEAAPSDDREGDPAVAVDLSQVPAEVLAPGLAQGEAPRGTVLIPEDLPSAIASAHTASATHLRVPKNTQFAEPITVQLTGAGSTRRSNQHFVLEALPGSEATIVLEHRGSALLTQNVEILVHDTARLTVISVQEWDDEAVHASAHTATVGAAAFLRHIVVTFGGGAVRLNPSLHLSGSGAEGEMYGLAFADAGQHLESQVYLHHDGPHTRGDVLYKGALQGTNARTVWIGDVLIGPDAVGTDSYEANRNLVLTDGARADSIPNLEIETGDIQGAGHASATGRFDDEQLFYLESRGVPEEQARRLVVLGFLMEIVQKLGVAALEERLAKSIDHELARGAGLPLASKAGA